MSEQSEHSEIALPKYEDAPELEKVPEFLKDDKWFDVNIDNDFLDFSEPYRPPRWTMKRNNVPFANVGELHIISGKPGHGKTNLMTQFMAVILSGKFGETEYTMPESVTNPIVLYIDTEQGKDDTIAIKNRVCTMSGMDYAKPQTCFAILRLRDTDDAKVRWRKVLKAIWKTRPTDIFLDGALDIVKDYNDQIECKPIIDKCMSTATEYDASFWIVLHENPMVDKLVGTLGSIMQRKVSEIFSVIKHKQAEEKQRKPGFPDIYFEVKQLKARGKDVDNWYFEVITAANGWGMPVELNEVGTQIDNPEEYKRQQERIEADDYLKPFNWTASGATYTDIDKYLRSKGLTSNRKIGDIINTAKEAGIIYQNDKKKYFYNGLTREVPNDAPNDLAFEPNENDDVPY